MKQIQRKMSKRILQYTTEKKKAKTHPNEGAKV